MVLEDSVIKAHKTASLIGSRRVCCSFSPSPSCWPPVKGFISQVSGGCLTTCFSFQHGERKEVTYYMERQPFVSHFSCLEPQLPARVDLGEQTVFGGIISGLYTALFCCSFLIVQRERNFHPKSFGTVCALPVAYLSNVTPHLSRCLRKTPASAFTPISHSHISFPCPPRFLFSFSALLQQQGENCTPPVYLRKWQ